MRRPSVRSVTTRASQRLQALSRRTYTAAAGHLEPAGDLATAADVEAVPARRWALAPRLAVAAGVLVLLLGGTFALRTHLAGGGPVPVPVVEADAGPDVGEADEEAWADDGAPEVEPEPVAAGTPRDDEPGVVVHVVGQVHEPGVVALPAGARVTDAIAAAGGAADGADLAALNLARRVTDGEQVYVPVPGEAVPAAAAPAASGAANPGGVNLNTATLADLDALPGIGPVLAGRILDWRAEHGRFTLVEELGEVAGIGPALLGRLRDLVTV